MDSSPMTQGAAYSFLPKKESRTDMERAVVLVVVEEDGAVAMVRRMRALEEEEEKALAEPRVEARRSREWLWRGMVDISSIAE